MKEVFPKQVTFKMGGLKVKENLMCLELSEMGGKGAWTEMEETVG